MTPHNQEERLREAPTSRFEGREHLIDLPSVIDQLHREPPPSHGHRQVAVFKRGAVTVSLFSFDAGAGLPEHQVDAVVLIQGLEGCVRITTPNGEYALKPSMPLTLDPGEVHKVHADEPSQILVTVCLQNN